MPSIKRVETEIRDFEQFRVVMRHALNRRDVRGDKATSRDTHANTGAKRARATPSRIGSVFTGPLCGSLGVRLSPAVVCGARP
jgi:hypothetical protein